MKGESRQEWCAFGAGSGEKVKLAKKHWAKEKALLRQSEHGLARQAESLKRVVVRLRAEREELRRALLREPSERVGMGEDYVLRASSSAASLRDKLSVGELAKRRDVELQSMLSEERVMQAEARDMKAQLEILATTSMDEK